jgi:hypothetical protein
MAADDLRDGREPGFPPMTCAEVRRRLPDLVGERLDASSAAAARRHLLECESCAAALQRLVAAAVAAQREPRSPYVPPAELYDTFQRMRTTPFGTLWMLVRDATRSMDADARAWGDARAAAITSSLNALLRPSPRAMSSGRGLVTVRRLRAVVPRADAERRGVGTDILAHVIDAAGAITSEMVRFVVDVLPHVTADGRFLARLHTAVMTHVGGVVLCAIDLGPPERVSFGGIVERDGDARTCQVKIDEAVPGVAAGEIPFDRILLFLTGP